MIYFKLLFKKNTYDDKITSITNLRFVSFQIWKFIFLLISLLLLGILNHLFIIGRFITFSFSLGAFVKIFLLGMGTDYIKVFLFQHNQNQNGLFERIVKLFLVPSQSTFVFFFLLVFTQLNTSAIKGLFIDNSSEENESDFTLVFSYSLLYTFKVINQHSFYKWPIQNKTRIDTFKEAFRQSFKKVIKFTLYNMVLACFYYLMKNTTVSLVYDLFVYLTIIFFCEVIQYISFQMLKCFICTPINPDSNQIRNEIELIAHPIQFSSSLSFVNMHYLIILNETLLRAYYQPKIQLNSLLISNDILKEIKFKIDSIYNRLAEKMKILHYSMKQQSKQFTSSLMTCFDFSKNEIFEHETSPTIIDLVTEIIYNNALLISTKKNKENNQYQEQYYLVYLIDRLFCFEKILKELRHLIDSDPKDKSFNHISKHLSVIISKIQMRIKSLVHKNLKEHFLINYNENIHEIIKQLRI